MTTIGELINSLPSPQKKLIRNIEKHNGKLSNIKTYLVFNETCMKEIY